MPLRSIHLWVFLLVAVGPLLAWPDVTPEDLEQNQRRWLQLRRFPDKTQKIRADAHAFFQLPLERQERYLRFDRELREEDSATQATLINVLERYQDWLERLPLEQKQKILGIADLKERLTAIRELREQEWMSRQPKSQREQWQKLSGEAKSQFVQALRAEERRSQADWNVATRFWRELENKVPLPCRLADFSREEQTYITDFLIPMLSPGEKDRLRKAEGNWPDYPSLLIELSDQHPLALPGLDGPKTISELPVFIQAKIKGGKIAPKWKIREGQWPSFAVGVMDFFSKRGDRPPNELWAFDVLCLKSPMQEFVKNVLSPVLSEKESLALINASGKWPDYPMTIQSLARAHGMHPPWYGLQFLSTGQGEKWASYRFSQNVAMHKLPDLPNASLRDFVLFEIDPRERAKLKLSTTDPQSIRRAQEAYFKQRQAELRKLQKIDEEKAVPMVRTLPMEKMNP